MSSKLGLNVLRWSLGIVILIEAVMFVLPSAALTRTGSGSPASG